LKKRKKNIKVIESVDCKRALEFKNIKGMIIQIQLGSLSDLICIKYACMI